MNTHYCNNNSCEIRNNICYQKQKVIFEKTGVS
jgi:hypothetical protein